MQRADKPVMITFRPTDEDFEILVWLKQRFGIGYTQILRLGLRKLYQAEKEQK